MHYQPSHHPLLDIAIGSCALVLLSLHTLASSQILGDVFTLAGWFVVTIGVLRSAFWLLRKFRRQ